MRCISSWKSHFRHPPCKISVYNKLPYLLKSKTRAPTPPPKWGNKPLVLDSSTMAGKWAVAAVQVLTQGQSCSSCRPSCCLCHCSPYPHAPPTHHAFSLPAASVPGLPTPIVYHCSSFSMAPAPFLTGAWRTCLLQPQINRVTIVQAAALAEPQSPISQSSYHCCHWYQARWWPEQTHAPYPRLERDQCSAQHM